MDEEDIKPEIRCIHENGMPLIATRGKSTSEVRGLCHEIMNHPEEFGSDRIKEILSYIRPEFSDVPGMIAFTSRRMYEDADGHLDVYDLSISRSVYDENIITGGGILYRGRVLKAEDRITTETIEEMVKDQSTPVIWVPRGLTLTIPEALFNDYALRFMQAPSHSPKDRFVAKAQTLGFDYNDLVAAYRTPNAISGRPKATRLGRAHLDFRDFEKYNPKSKATLALILEHFQRILGRRVEIKPRVRIKDSRGMPAPRDGSDFSYECDVSRENGEIRVTGCGPDDALLGFEKADYTRKRFQPRHSY